MENVINYIINLPVPYMILGVLTGLCLYLLFDD